MLQTGIQSGNLKFSTSAALALRDVEVLWVTFDTPVDLDDQADVAFVEGQIKLTLSFLRDDTVVLISSQMPVGSIRRLEAYALEKLPSKRLEFACSPENLRLGNAIEAFLHPDRIVVGVRNDRTRQVLERLLSNTAGKMEWMSVESAEMTKHALNAFLATSITFVNEIAAICELVGADAKEVERGLKTEARIGPKAYLSPGGPFAGGTLARDLAFLEIESQARKLTTPLLSAVRPSNDEHKNWVRRKLQQQLGSLSKATVAIWGLTYKPGTDTLRRSLAVDLCDWLLKQGAKVRVYDPVVNQLPEHWTGKVIQCAAALDAVLEADALVVGTEWPEFKQFSLQLSARARAGLVVVDANRHLQQEELQPGFYYVAVGTPSMVGAK
jgi:UDPglucose 6-dehydrogenase